MDLMASNSKFLLDVADLKRERCNERCKKLSDWGNRWKLGMMRGFGVYVDEIWGFVGRE